MVQNTVEGPQTAAKMLAVTESGDRDGPPVVFAHGYACDQNIWRLVAPAFEDSHRVILFDHVGAGHADRSRWSATSYPDLDAHAGDMVALLDELDLRDALLVGHSAGAMISALASIRRPERVAGLVMLSPSPRYVDDPETGWRGGFSREEVEELLESIDRNHFAWSVAMAPVIMNAPERPELAEELSAMYCRTDPDIATHMARMTFLSDHRADLARVPVPALVLQTRADIVVPEEVGAAMAATMPRGRMLLMDAMGHCPQMSAPAETIAAIRDALTAGAAGVG
ncbi:MAG: alpha/beta hydrolase [Miltoncostaeaceae bacterium]